MMTIGHANHEIGHLGDARLKTMLNATMSEIGFIENTF
jgi:hypothetical protein